MEKHAGETFDVIVWEQSYRRLLDQVRKANPNVRIILGTPFAAKVGKVGNASHWIWDGIHQTAPVTN